VSLPQDLLLNGRESANLTVPKVNLVEARRRYRAGYMSIADTI
jgi:hypothetical protein